MGFGVRPGSVMDLTRSASGHVLLAFQTPEDRRRILSPVGKGGADIDADTKTLKELDRVREQGFEEMDSTRLKGIHDISYPVFDHRKSAVAAMTIPYIERLDVSGGMPVADVRAILGKAVAALSLTLGGGADSKHA
jgi:DNA-binding IclR family transcriptional regulator